MVGVNIGKLEVSCSVFVLESWKEVTNVLSLKNGISIVFWKIFFKN